MLLLLTWNLGICSWVGTRGSLRSSYPRTKTEKFRKRLNTGTRQNRGGAGEKLTIPRVHVEMNNAAEPCQRRVVTTRRYRLGNVASSEWCKVSPRRYRRSWDNPGTIVHCYTRLDQAIKDMPQGIDRQMVVSATQLMHPFVQVSKPPKFHEQKVIRVVKAGCHDQLFSTVAQSCSSGSRQPVLEPEELHDVWRATKYL